MKLRAWFYWVGLLPLPCLLVSPSAPTTPAGGETTVESGARVAVERSLPFLERDGLAWMEGRVPIQEGTGCVSCHHVGFAVWSHREARRAGIPFPEERIAALATRAEDFLASDSKGRTVSWGQLILGRDQSAAGADAREPWPFSRSSILKAQLDDGYWEAKGQFPRQNRSRMESDAVATMWTILALSSFEEIGESIHESRARAAAWLAESDPGESGEWLLARLLVEQEVGGPEAVRGLQERLLDQQHPDGGWSWKLQDPSNAYSTGQSLYALARVGLAPEHPAIQRGVRYLAETQREDGTWFTPSKLTSAEGTEEKDYIYTYWGTAWAAIGLARTLPVAAPAE